MLRSLSLAVLLSTLVAGAVQAATLFGPGVGWVDTVPLETATERWQIDVSFDLRLNDSLFWGVNTSGYMDVERTRTADIGGAVYDFDTEIVTFSANTQRPFLGDTQEMILSLNTTEVLFENVGQVFQKIPLAGGTDVATSVFDLLLDIQILTPILDNDTGVRTGTSIQNLHNALPLKLSSDILAYPPEGATYLSDTVSLDGLWSLENFTLVVTDSGPSPVPVPAAVWLFGSGLIGLIGIARRKKA